MRLLLRNRDIRNIKAITPKKGKGWDEEVLPFLGMTVVGGAVGGSGEVGDGSGGAISSSPIS